MLLSSSLSGLSISTSASMSKKWSAPTPFLPSALLGQLDIAINLICAALAVRLASSGPGSKIRSAFSSSTPCLRHFRCIEFHTSHFSVRILVYGINIYMYWAQFTNENLQCIKLVVVGGEAGSCAGRKLIHFLSHPNLVCHDFPLYLIFSVLSTVISISQYLIISLTWLYCAVDTCWFHFAYCFISFSFPLWWSPLFSPYLSLSFPSFTYSWTPVLTVKDLPTSFHSYLISLVLSYSTMFRHIRFFLTWLMVDIARDPLVYIGSHVT